MFRSAIFVLFLAPTIVSAQSADYLRSNPKFVEAFRDAVRPHAPSIVQIRCDGKDVCLGTVVGESGWILTKAHDLKGKIICKLHDGREFEAATVGVHEPHDLALLRIAAKGLRPIQFLDSRDTKVGSWIACVGAGQDAAAVGVVSVATRKVHEAYLGVLVDAAPNGIFIAGVAQKAAAYKAGLRPKDVILDVNNKQVVDADQFQQMLGELKPGDVITLRVQRNGKDLEIKATLQSREEAGDFRSEFQNRLGSDLSSRRSGYSLILQHDAVLKPSDCGGPLVDLKGKAIGINISRAGRVESFAIPGEVVSAVIAELISKKK